MNGDTETFHRLRPGEKGESIPQCEPLAKECKLLRGATSCGASLRERSSSSHALPEEFSAITGGWDDGLSHQGHRDKFGRLRESRDLSTFHSEMRETCLVRWGDSSDTSRALGKY